MNSWREAYAEANLNNDPTQTPDSWNLTSVMATCYPNKGDFGLTVNDNMEVQEGSAVEGTDYFKDTVGLDSDTRDEPVAVTGKIALKANNSYKCHWKYGTRGEGDLVDVGSVSHIQGNQDAVSYFTGKYTGPGPGLKAAYGIGEFKEYAESLP